MRTIERLSARVAGGVSLAWDPVAVKRSPALGFVLAILGSSGCGRREGPQASSDADGVAASTAVGGTSGGDRGGSSGTADGGSSADASGGSAVGGDGGSSAAGTKGGAGGREPDPTLCSKDGWCWEHPKTTGEELYGAWGAARDDVWTVGGGGTVLHFDGRQWQRFALPTRALFGGVWGAARDDVWAVTAEGEIFHFDGAAWSPSTMISGVRLRAVWAAPTGEAWAVGGTPEDRAVILHFDGRSWAEVDSGMTLNSLEQVFGTGANDVYVLAGGGAVVHWDGSGWSRVTYPTPGNMRVVWGTSANDMWGGGGQTQPDMYHYDGTAWTRVDFDTSSGFITAIWGYDANHAWAASRRQLWEWNGTRWSELTPSPSVGDNVIWIHAGWAPGPDEAWAFGYPGIIYRFDGGIWSGTWRATLTLQSIWGSSIDDVWAVGTPSGSAEAAALHYGGGRWSVDALGFNFTAVSGVAVGDVWAIGPPVHHFDGSRWLAAPSATNPPTGRLHGVWARESNDVWLAGQGAIHRYDGNQWTQALFDAGQDFVRAFGTSENDVWALASTGTNAVMHYDGNVWASRPTGGSERPLGIWGAAPNDVWLAGAFTSFLHWNGSSYESVPKPVEATINALWGRSPTDVYAVGDEGTILHFDGVSWTQEESGYSRELVSVWGTGTDLVLASGDNGAVLRKGTLGTGGGPMGCDPTGRSCVLCGAERCSPGQVCCGGTSERCVSPGTCTTSISSACDGNEECMDAGQRCCVSLSIQSVALTSATATCGNCMLASGSTGSGGSVTSVACRTALDCSGVIGEFDVAYSSCCFVPGLSVGTCVSESQAAFTFEPAGGSCQ